VHAHLSLLKRHCGTLPLRALLRILLLKNTVRICLGRYPVVARRCLASYTPRLAELQVEGGNVGLNGGSAATPPGDRHLLPQAPLRSCAAARFSVNLDKIGSKEQWSLTESDLSLTERMI